METLDNANNVQLRKSNFGYVFGPNYYFSQFAGLWSFSIIHDSSGKIKGARASLFDIARSILFIYLNLTFAFSTYKKVNVRKEEIDDQLRFIVLNTFLMSSLLFGVFGIVMDVINRNKLVDILMKFNTFDDEISRFGVRFNYKHDYQRSWIYLLTPTAVALFLLTILVFILLHKDTLEFIRCLSVNSLHFVIWISVIVSFIIFLRSLCERYEAINSLLRNRFLNRNTLKVSVNMCKKDSIDTVKFVGHQHANLTDIMDQLNVCYSFQIMVSVSGTFIVSVMSLYVYCNYVLYPELDIATLPWLYTGWLILHITGTLMVIYHSSSLAEEGKRTFRIAHDIINCCNDAELMQSLLYLSHQTECRHPIVTCGLFTFDWTLLFNMIAATATYLIIALNFGRTQQ